MKRTGVKRREEGKRATNSHRVATGQWLASLRHEFKFTGASAILEGLRATLRYLTRAHALLRQTAHNVRKRCRAAQPVANCASQHKFKRPQMFPIKNQSFKMKFVLQLVHNLGMCWVHIAASHTLGPMFTKQS